MIAWACWTILGVIVIRILASIGIIGWLVIILFLLYVAGGGFEERKHVEAKPTLSKAQIARMRE